MSHAVAPSTFDSEIYAREQAAEDRREAELAEAFGDGDPADAEGGW